MPDAPTVGASVEFLTDENTVYPVYIDPTLTVNSGTDYIEDTTIYSSKSAINYGTDTKLVVGTSVATFNITSLAKEWPCGAYYPNSGFLIKLADDKEGSDCKRLYTTEYTTASYRPYATFTYLEDGVYRIRNVNSSLNDIKEHLKKHHCD